MWPVGDFDLRARVVVALLALIGTKFVAILAPILQAWAVDDLAGDGVPAFALGAIGLTVAYGVARILTNGFQQIRDALFAKVAQRALRSLARETFEHIHR
ncbi:MAG: metal ABC transporter permease, partial [Rhodobiaceae bacterium]